MLSRKEIVLLIVFICLVLPMAILSVACTLRHSNLPSEDIDITVGEPVIGGEPPTPGGWSIEAGDPAGFNMFIAQYCYLQNKGEGYFRHTFGAMGPVPVNHIETFSFSFNPDGTAVGELEITTSQRWESLTLTTTGNYTYFLKDTPASPKVEFGFDIVSFSGTAQVDGGPAVPISKWLGNLFWGAADKDEWDPEECENLVPLAPLKYDPLPLVPLVPPQNEGDLPLLPLVPPR